MWPYMGSMGWWMVFWWVAGIAVPVLLVRLMAARSAALPLAAMRRLSESWSGGPQRARSSERGINGAWKISDGNPQGIVRKGDQPWRLLEKLPAIIEASSGVFGAVAAPFGNIDKLVVMDTGSGSVASGGSLARLAQTSPAVVFNLLQQMEALGLSVPEVLQQIGVKAPEHVVAPPPAGSAPEVAPSARR